MDPENKRKWLKKKSPSKIQLFRKNVVLSSIPKKELSSAPDQKMGIFRVQDTKKGCLVQVQNKMGTSRVWDPEKEREEICQDQNSRSLEFENECRKNLEAKWCFYSK